MAADPPAPPSRVLPSPLFAPLRQLRWKLTVSYTLVTVGALLAAELITILLLVLLILTTPTFALVVHQWLRIGIAPELHPYLEEPFDGGERLAVKLAGLFPEPEQRPIQIGLNTDADFSNTPLPLGGDGLFFVVDAEGRLRGAMTPAESEPYPVGEPLAVASIAGAAGPLASALAGENDFSRQYTRLSINRTVLSTPVRNPQGEVVGALLVVISVIPSVSNAVQSLLAFIATSAVVFTVISGVVGSAFGFLTARSMTRRLRHLAHAADAWSKGDFTAAAADRSPDEVGQLAQHLNRMAEQLQNLLYTRQELAALEERNRLARDLHDSVKQQVFATTMQLAAARALVERDPSQAAHRLDEAARLAHQAQQELMALIQELRPPALKGKSLADALKEYVANGARAGGVAASVEVVGDGALPLVAEQAIFRVAQEALANASRHSHATQVAVRLHWLGDGVLLTVRDNGQGFDPAAAEGVGMGLRSMRERMEALGGSVTVESKAGQGTQVSVRYHEPGHRPMSPVPEGATHD